MAHEGLSATVSWSGRRRSAGRDRTVRPVIFNLQSALRLLNPIQKAKGPLFCSPFHERSALHDEGRSLRPSRARERAMTCEQRQTLLQLVEQLRARGFDVRVGWIDCDVHGKHAAHFRHSRAAASRSFPQTPDEAVGRNPKVAKVQVHATGNGIRPEPHADQIPLPLWR